MKMLLKLSLIFIVSVLIAFSQITAYASQLTVDPDVNRDNICNANDLISMRKILLNVSDVSFFDVNCDGKCNVKDLVSLKNYQSGDNIGDNFYADNWSL